MKVIVSLAAIVAALALGAGSAPAQPSSTPWITPSRAATILYVNDIEWEDEYDTVLYASCRGYGQRLGMRYKHFTCYVEVDNDDSYWVRAHSVNGGLDVEFLYYD